MGNKTLHQQLTDLSLRFRIFGRAEVKELRKILRADESILNCLYGYYQGGSGILVATDKRILLIDKRAFFLNIEEMNYIDINEIVAEHSFLQATLKVGTAKKKLEFRSVSDARIKHMHHLIAYQIAENLRLQEIFEGRAEHFPWAERPAQMLGRKRPTKFGVALNHLVTE